jgi:hypothetical protein
MNRRQQQVIGLILFGILVAGALVGGGWWLGQRSDPGASVVTIPPAATPASPDTSTTPAPPTSRALVGSWRRLPAALIPGGTYAGVWTGNELLLHGPSFGFEDGKYVGRSVGAAYNPAARTWRVLPPARARCRPSRAGTRPSGPDGSSSAGGWLGRGVQSGSQPLAEDRHRRECLGGHGLDRPAGAHLGRGLLR